MTESVLRKMIYLKANKEQVWAYLTDPENLAIWFHKPEKPLVAGESYEMFGTTSGDKLMWGEVIAADPYSLLEYTFSIGPMNGASSTVRWTLEDVDGGTQLSLEHSGLPQGEEAFGLTLALDKGWDDHIGRMRESIHKG